MSHAAAVVAAMLIGFVLCFGVFWFLHAAPPRTIVITSGTPGSSFETYAMKYRQILARNGVTLKVLPSQGSLENLKRLQDSVVRVDVGFVQGGVTNGSNHRKLVSLGSVAYQPLMVFHRGTNSLSLLSELAGQRLAIGPDGSGTRSLALILLGLNGIHPGGATTLLDLEGETAAKALLESAVDAVFLMGDSTSPQVMRQLLLTPGIQILNFTQADGYVRRITYLNKLELPKGSIDFGKIFPTQDIYLLGPTVELLARPVRAPGLSEFHQYPAQ